VADPEILKKGGVGRQCINLVVIYRKRKQRTICLLYATRRPIEKNLSQGGGEAAAPPPLWIHHLWQLTGAWHNAETGKQWNAETLFEMVALPGHSIFWRQAINSGADVVSKSGEGKGRMEVRRWPVNRSGWGGGFHSPPCTQGSLLSYCCYSSYVISRRIMTYFWQKSGRTVVLATPNPNSGEVPLPISAYPWFMLMHDA